MNDKVNDPVKARHERAAAFQVRRSIARKRAVQFLFGLDIRKDWTVDVVQLQEFRQLMAELEEEAESLSAKDLEKSQTYMEKLIRGVCVEVEKLDERIRSAADNWRLERMGPVERSILRVATYEICMEGMVPAVAINEAVELAKKFGESETPRFVNGVLDRIRRQLQQPETAAAAGTEDAAAEDASATEEAEADSEATAAAAEQPAAEKSDEA